MIERPLQGQEYARIRKARFRVEADLRQKRLHLVECRRPLADLEHGPQIADRVTAPHSDLSRRPRVPRCSSEVHMPGRVHIVEIRAEKAHMTANVQIDIQNDVRQLVVRLGNRRNGDKGTVNINMTRELWQLLAPVFILRQRQRAGQGSLEEGGFEIECIHHKGKIICRRPHAGKTHAPRQQIAARAHASRTLTHGDGITERVDLYPHIRQRMLDTLELHRAAGNAQRALKARCGKRAVQLQIALGTPERPLYAVGEYRQQGQIGVVKHKRQVDLLIGAQRFIAPRRERAQRQRAADTRHICSPVDVFRHRELVQINDRTAQLRLSLQLIERRAAYTAVLCREMHIHLGILRAAADMHGRRRRSRYFFFHSGKSGKDAERDI